MDIVDLTRLLSYYSAGGGKNKNQAGELLAGLGQAAGGIGEGISKAYAPKLAMQKTQREIAAKTLDAALTHGNNQFQSEDINKILTSGKFPAGIKIGENKKTLFKVYDPDTGEYSDMSLPEGGGYSDMKVIGRPKTPSTAHQPTTQERSFLNTLKQYDVAVAGGNVEPGLKKRARAAAEALGIDTTPFDAEEPPAQNDGPGFFEQAWEGLKSGGTAVANQVSGLQKKLSAKTDATKGAPADQAAIAHLTSIRAKLTPKNIAWAKGQLKSKGK